MNQRDQNLYFIALIPDEQLKYLVKSLKEEMRDKFAAKHALKSPAHITLVPPFRREDSHERFIFDSLQRFSSGRESFEVQLSGFNSFPPRVIYIDVNNPGPIISLHSNLKETLLDEMLFNAEELKSKFHPHMTIATRDLSHENYHRAWLNFKNRNFEDNFMVDRIHLLKHNGKFWDIYQEFMFGN